MAVKASVHAVAHLLLLVASMLVASSGLAKEKSKEQAAIDDAIQAVDACYHWGGEVGDQSAERSEQISKAVQTDCSHAKTLIGKVTAEYPGNPRLLEGIAQLVEIEWLDEKDPVISKYCSGLAPLFKEHPSSSWAGSYRSVCLNHGTASPL